MEEMEDIDDEELKSTLLKYEEKILEKVSPPDLEDGERRFFSTRPWRRRQ